MVQIGIAVRAVEAAADDVDAAVEHFGARVIAGVNVLNAAFMVGGSVVIALLHWVGLTTPGVFILIGVCTIGVAIMFAIVVAINVITSAFKARLDLTEEKLYTLTPGTRAILKTVFVLPDI